ncbi:protein of unknown function [Desulfosporosinus hippei DSM 8344]|uniref:DUF4935 domain-containing protein n=1 Tax=Desulfosporosinus hippei DSM 8344 TaxID=1121419 RepID=A0A1G8KU83_9FIRM|nr:protein of unknown function [Desulfosporosinus hippei DSM 8344]
MIVILDSNILTADFRMLGNNFKLLLNFLNRTDSTLAIPKVVMLEVKNNFLSELQKAQTAVEKEIAGLKGRIGNITLANPLSDGWLEREYKQYSESLDKKLINIGAVILDHPNVSHQAVIERAVPKKKPFKPNGDGYRDTLIWESVLEVLESKQKAVALVSRNSHDFCVKGRNSMFLHDDLKMDLLQREIPNEKLKFYVDLKDFLEDLVLPNFEKHEELREKIIQQQYPFENLNTIILSKLSNVVNDKHSDVNEIYFENEFEGPRFLGMDHKGKLVVKDIREISKQELYISMEMLSVAHFEGVVRKINFRQKEGYINFYQSEDNMQYFEVTKMVVINTHFNLIFSNVTNDITTVEIETVQEI